MGMLLRRYHKPTVVEETPKEVEPAVVEESKRKPRKARGKEDDTENN